MAAGGAMPVVQGTSASGCALDLLLDFERAAAGGGSGSAFEAPAAFGTVGSALGTALGTVVSSAAGVTAAGLGGNRTSGGGGGLAFDRPLRGCGVLVRFRAGAGDGVAMRNVGTTVGTVGTGSGCGASGC